MVCALHRNFRDYTVTMTHHTLGRSALPHTVSTACRTVSSVPSTLEWPPCHRKDRLRWNLECPIAEFITTLARLGHVFDFLVELLKAHADPVLPKVHGTIALCVHRIVGLITRLFARGRL